MSGTTAAATSFVSRSLAPTTMVFPEESSAWRMARRAFDMLCILPPMNVSSVSTGPEKAGAPRAQDWRIRCARCHAVFWVIPRSRCSFMEDWPFSPVVSR